jgi:tetratricopeptide (TPR) repeat protein
MIFSKTLIVLFLLLSIAPGVRDLVGDGNRYYAEGEYEEALEKYQNAQVNAPQSMVIRFNLADALIQLQRVEESLNELSRVVASGDSALASMASYNAAKVMTDSGDLEAGISGYVNSLRLNPDDGDAKHNLELLLRKLQSQQNQQQQQQEQSQQQDEQKQQQQEQQERDKQQEREQQEQDRSDQQEMSEEDAARILDAVRSEEEKIQEEMHRARAQNPIRVEKDW